VNKNRFSAIFFPVLLGFSLLLSRPAFSQKGEAAKPARDSLRYKFNPVYGLSLAMYDAYKIRQADIVMLGNSLTHGAAWNELLGRLNVVERGIPADGLDGYAARMNYVYKLNPKIVFIMGGLNDVYNAESADDIFKVYVRIIEGLRVRKIIPVIQSTTYGAKTYGKDYGLTPATNAGRNREIDKLNKLLSDYAKRNNLDYIDVTTLTSTKDGYLRPELTIDGIHLKAEAYKLWGAEVEKVLIKHRL
jgi:lysophospholipase L1-like esterase